MLVLENKRKLQRRKTGYGKYGYKKPQIPIGRAGKLDFGDGFLYVKKIQYTPEKVYVRCSMMNEIGCKASYVVSINSDGTYNTDNLRCVTPHNHPPNELAVRTEKFLSELLKAVEVMPGTTREVYDFVAQSFPDVARVYCYQSVVPRMHRWLKKAKENDK